MPAKPRHIQQLLSQDSTLQPLFAQVQQQRHLLASIRQTLPPNIARHCSAACLNGTVLNLFTDSPVWVSKLRFQSPQLLSKLRAHHPGIASIAVSCNAPVKSSANRAKPPKARRSDFAAESVSESARSISSPTLQAALRRLALALREK